MAVDADTPGSHVHSKTMFLEIEGGLVPFFVETIRQKDSNNILVVFEDYATPDKAQKLVGQRVYLPSEQLTELEEDQFYFHDIIGYTVIDSRVGELGAIAQVLDAPEQELLQVFYKGKEVLIPLVDEFIVRVNKRGKQLFMDLPDGLIDLYLDN